jgi:hypothetical protein
LVLSTVEGAFRHRVLLVATDVGLLMSHDDGKTFERRQTAGEDGAVLAVATSPVVGSERRFFAATAGGVLLASEVTVV